MKISRDTRVETAAEDGRKTGGLETVLIGPLPRILEVRLVARLVVGRVEVVAAAFEAGVHDREILVRKRHVDHDVGFERAEQFAQLRHAVGVDLGGLHAVAADGGRNGVAFGFGTAGQHHVREAGLAAIFCVTTVPTPPAPIISALHIELFGFKVRFHLNASKISFISAKQNPRAKFHDPGRPKPPEDARTPIACRRQPAAGKAKNTLLRKICRPGIGF